MARALDPGFVTEPDEVRWRSDEGWPYPDGDEVDGACEDLPDLDAEPDEELLSLLGLGGHLLDGLTDVEAAVVAGRFGLDGRPARSMRDLQMELDLERADLRLALGDALRKVREHLA